MGCHYDCINGQLVLLTGDCPLVPCAQDGGPCDSPGQIMFKKCPRPFVVDDTTDTGE